MRKTIGFYGVLAGALLCFLGSNARAALVLSIKNGPTGQGFQVVENGPGSFSVNPLGGYGGSVTFTAADDHIDATGTILGYTFHAVLNSNEDAGGTFGIVSLDVDVTADSSAAATNFQFFGSDSPFTHPGTASDTLYMKATQVNGTTFDPGFSVKSRGSFFSPTGAGLVETAFVGPLTTAGASGSSTAIISPRGDAYGLSDVGGLLDTAGGAGAASFHSQVVTALPEPSGILVGLVGVPCMFVALFFAKRRSLNAAAMA